MIQWFLKSNLFLFACGILQLGGSVTFLIRKQPLFGILYFLYALTNFVLWIAKPQ